MIKLLLVDDQSIVRPGLRMRLLMEPDITVVGEASSGEQVVAFVEMCGAVENLLATIRTAVEHQSKI